MDTYAMCGIALRKCISQFELSLFCPAFCCNGNHNKQWFYREWLRLSILIALFSSFIGFAHFLDCLRVYMCVFFFCWLPPKFCHYILYLFATIWKIKFNFFVLRFFVVAALALAWWSIKYSFQHEHDMFFRAAFSAEATLRETIKATTTYLYANIRKRWQQCAVSAILLWQHIVFLSFFFYFCNVPILIGCFHKWHHHTIKTRTHTSNDQDERNKRE